MSLLGQVLVTALGALLGAWAGAHMALYRFKSERAFALRYEWYRDAIRSLLEGRDELEDCARELEVSGLNDDETVPEPLLLRAGKALDHSVRLRVEGRMLAREMSFEELQESAERLSKALEPDDDEGAQTLIWAFRSIGREYAHTAEKLADHGREHLKFQELEASEVSLGARLSTAARALRGDLPSSR